MFSNQTGEKNSEPSSSSSIPAGHPPTQQAEPVLNKSLGEGVWGEEPGRYGRPFFRRTSGANSDVSTNVNPPVVAVEDTERKGVVFELGSAPKF